MPRPIRLTAPALHQHTNGNWYAKWYDPGSNRVHRVSLRTSDKDVARAQLEAFRLPKRHEANLPTPAQWRAQAHKMCRRAKENARMKGRAYVLSIEDVLALFEAQGHRCAVSRMRLRLSGEKKCPWAPSLDQIAPGGGYVPGNVRIVMSIVNAAMHTWGVDPLLDLGREMAKNVTPQVTGGKTFSQAFLARSTSQLSQ